MDKITINNILLVFATVLFTVCIVYLTPLKHKNIIEPNINDITPENFYALYVENPDEYIFIDVRSPSQYGNLHAEGSINMPLHTLYDQRKNLPKTGKTIVLICSGGRASGVGYSYLEHYGFLNLRRVEGGVEAWNSVGLPVISNN